MPNYSGVWNLTTVLGAINVGNWPDATAPIALFHGQGSTSIDRVDINTTGNATDFGDFANDSAEKVELIYASLVFGGLHNKRR